MIKNLRVSLFTQTSALFSLVILLIKERVVIVEKTQEKVDVFMLSLECTRM